MAIEWILLIMFHCQSIKLTYQSIAGVTYMDQFDFEERYRDVNECNPLHWHPLHLPPYCMDMFDKLIRSRIAAINPFRILTTRYRPTIADEIYNFNLEDQEYIDPSSPYEMMLHLIRKDVIKDPSAPSVQFLPGLGPVALYRQAVSRKTKDLITQLSAAYGKAAQESYADFAPYPQYPTVQIYIEGKGKKKKSEKSKKEEEGRRRKNSDP